MNLRTTLRLSALGLLAGLVAVAFRYRAMLAPEAIGAAIAGQPAAPLLFLLAHVGASLLFVPRLVLAAAAGILFGVAWGIVWAAAGSVIGAIAGFLVARYINGGLIDLEHLKRIGPVLQRAEAGGWRSVMALRLIPVMNHSATNYALGLTRLPIASYALGSLLGQFPLTVAYVEFGAAGGRWLGGGAKWLAPTLIGLAALGIAVLLPWLMRRALANRAG